MSRRAAASLAGFGLALFPLTAVAGVCRYDGTTSHGGRVAVRTEVTAAGGAVTVDVLLALTATTMGFFDVRDLMQETNTWRGGEVQSVAVNARYGVDGGIKRQQSDVFVRGAGGLEGYRVQGKTLTDLQQHHPGFVGHWAPATFGQPWLQDDAGAAPERRSDPDLPRPAMPPGLRPPLALAFYWSRWLAPDGGTVPALLPRFEQHARADLSFEAASRAMAGRCGKRHSGTPA